MSRLLTSFDSQTSAEMLFRDLKYVRTLYNMRVVRPTSCDALKEILGKQFRIRMSFKITVSKQILVEKIDLVR